MFARGLGDLGRVWKWKRKIGALGLDGMEIWRKRPDRSFFPVLGGKSVWRLNALDARVLGVRMPVAQRVSAVGGQKKHGEPSSAARRIVAVQRPYKGPTNAALTQRDFEESLPIYRVEKRQKSIVCMRFCIICIKIHLQISNDKTNAAWYNMDVNAWTNTSGSWLPDEKRKGVSYGNHLSQPNRRSHVQLPRSQR